MLRHYHLIIGTYTLLMILHSASALLLFVTKLGWSPDSIKNFYLGNSALMASAQTRSGLIETAVPHLASIGLTTFILAHLLIFVPQISVRLKWTLGLTFCISGILDIATGFLISSYGPGFAIFKGMSFLAFQLSYWGILWVLVRAALINTHVKDRARQPP